MGSSDEKVAGAESRSPGPQLPTGRATAAAAAAAAAEAPIAKLLPTTVVISFEDEAADQVRGWSGSPPRAALGDIETAAAPVNAAVAAASIVAVQTRVAARHLGAMLANRSRFSAPVEAQTFEARLAEQLIVACASKATEPVAAAAAAASDAALREAVASEHTAGDGVVSVLTGVSLSAANQRFSEIVFRWPSSAASTANWSNAPDMGEEWSVSRNLAARLSEGTRGARYAARFAGLLAVALLYLLVVTGLVVAVSGATRRVPGRDAGMTRLYVGARLSASDFLHETDAAIVAGWLPGVASLLFGLVGQVVALGVTIGPLTVLPVWLVAHNESVLALCLALDHLLLAVGFRLAWCTALAAFLCVCLRVPLRVWEHRQTLVRPRLTRRQLERAIADTLRVAAPRLVPADWIAQEAQRLHRPSDSLAPDMQSPPGRIVLVRGHYTASALVDAYRKLATAERRAERLCHIHIVRGAA